MTVLDQLEAERMVLANRLAALTTAIDALAPFMEPVKLNGNHRSAEASATVPQTKPWSKKMGSVTRRAISWFRANPGPHSTAEIFSGMGLRSGTRARARTGIMLCNSNHFRRVGRGVYALREQS